MENQHAKLDRPGRVAELNPTETLKKIGFENGQVLCDIGAGTGLFAIPAARMSKKTVFAIEIKEEYICFLDEKSREENLANLITIKADGFEYAIESLTVDYVLMVTVLHEIENKEAILTEVKRILKGKGKLVVIEFHKRQTSMGPPIPHRIAKDEVIPLCEPYGFTQADSFDLGENYYCLVLQKDK